jgi:L,D-peptidoglycan transpeptidase YkuD (ErfK/YbiS/YcfS/YnhG family)
MRRVAAAVVVALVALAAPTARGISLGRTPGARVALASSARPAGVRLRHTGDATRVVTVTAAYGDTQARVAAYRRTAAGGWALVHGPYTAWIGRAGFARPGGKREGDGATPSGSYHFSFAFGVAAKPSGVSLPWRHAGTSDFWDDDSASPRYNEWVDARHHSAGRDPEPMHVSPSYDVGAAIAYNTARTPGRGSAIFLHVTHHSPTSGCVALPRPAVVRILRWLHPASHPRILMGTPSTVRG